MRRASMRALVALAGVVALTACGAQTPTGAGGLSAAGGGSPVVSGAPTLAPAPSAVATTTPKHQGGGNPPASAAPPSGPPSPGSPSGVPPKPPRTLKPHIRGNYRINDFQAPCSWRLIAGAVQVTALFEIVHTGILPPGDVPFTSSDDVTGGYWIGTMQQIFWESTQYPVSIGSYAYDNYAGKAVTMSVTIRPTGVDDDKSDNTASRVIHVPADATEDGAPGQHSFTC